MKRRILDDNPAICHLLETLVSFAGHLVDAFTDPADCVLHIDAFAWIVVDFQLPGKQSGAEVIRQARLSRMRKLWGDSHSGGERLVVAA